MKNAAQSGAHQPAGQVDVDPSRFVFFSWKNSWLNAQLAEAVKFSSHKSQSSLQDRHRT
jgi:hypothetical protein